MPLRSTSRRSPWGAPGPYGSLLYPAGATWCHLVHFDHSSSCDIITPTPALAFDRDPDHQRRVFGATLHSARVVRGRCVTEKRCEMTGAVLARVRTTRWSHPVRVSDCVLVVLIGLFVWWAAPVYAEAPTPPVPVPSDESGFAHVQVIAVAFDETLGHNLPNLSVGPKYNYHQPPGIDDPRMASFADFYNANGGLTRWGYATSEVFEEFPCVLTQYYQRGVVEWRLSPSAPPADCVPLETFLPNFAFQRKLAWDYIGGGLGGSVDQGVEPGFTNPNPGLLLGPWGHKVSNFSVEGTPIGFLDFFNALGGVDSFGYPKTDARMDDHPEAILAAPGTTPGFIRQYFQAAVIEYHPDAPAGFKVKLSLLGDTLRNLTYPGDTWNELAPFQVTDPLSVGDFLVGG